MRNLFTPSRLEALSARLHADARMVLSPDGPLAVSALAATAVAGVTALGALYLLAAGHIAAAIGVTLVLCMAGIAAGVLAGLHMARGAAPARETRIGPDASLEAVVGAIVRYRADGRPISISRRAGALLGCRPFELADTGLFERVHVMDRPAYRKAVRDVAETGQGTELEIRMRRDAGASGASGHYVWLELTLAPIADPKAGAGVIGILRDISERKRSEEALRRARAEAEEALEAKSRFLATIGHELRTPLNAIVGFSDMMAEGIGGTLTPTHKEYAGHIRQSGHHLIDVVSMLLDMSRIEAGKFELQAEAFSPDALVEPCLQMVEKLGRDRQVMVETRLPQRLPAIVGDERACRQIVINLLSNAIKFSHPGGRVTLAMKRQGKMLNIGVTDTGIGMPPETISRIGEPFLQAQNSLSRRYEGTGLGLSIVKGLVALHGGRLEVVSEPGTGTAVSVLLPLDGPSAGASRTGNIAHLPRTERNSDEDTWLEDERKSAAQ